MKPQGHFQSTDFDDDFDDAEDFDDPAYDASPVAPPHPSVMPKASKPAYAPSHDEAYDAYPMVAASNDVSLPRTQLVLRTNRLQQLGKEPGSALRCDVPLSRITRVELRFAPGFADLVLVFFFAGLTVALMELLPSGWLRGILAIISGLFAAGMLFGIIVTRALRIHTSQRVFDIVLDDDVREAEAFTASLQARIDEHHTGPFR